MTTFFDPLSERAFTSPNMTDPPSSIFLPAPIGPDDLLENLGTLRLMSVRYPHLPYAFRNPLCTGPLFSCLHCNEKTIPILHSEKTFTLCPSLLSKWSELDKFLTQVFFAFPVPPGCYRNVIFRPVPFDAAYSSPYRTADALRLAAKRALMAFQHLIALCSWKIASHKEFTDDVSWVKTLLSKGLPPTMVEMLRVSPVATISLSDPRVGAVIDVTDHACLAHAKPLYDASVPVYICWGTWTEFREQCRRLIFGRGPESVGMETTQWFNANCWPAQELLTGAFGANGCPPASTSVPPGPTRVIPPPVKGSGQRPGEKWTEFFTRRAQAHPAILANESSVEKQRREQRAKNALRVRAPGRKGANVFYWDKINGFRIRTPIGYDHYVGIWCDYHGAQRRYDVFKDEWDLCSEFDADAESECDEDDNSDVDPPMVSKKPPKSTASCSVPVQHSIPGSSPKAIQSSTAVSDILPSLIPELSVDMVVGCESSSSDQQTLRNGPPEPEASSGDHISACEAQLEADPLPGDQPMLCDPPPEHTHCLDGQQQPLADVPLVEQPTSQQEAVSPRGQPMICDPLPDQRSASGQQLPSVMAPLAEEQISQPVAEAPLEDNSLPDLQPSANAHPASVFTGNEMPESQVSRTMHLQDVLEMWYGFTYSPSSGVARQTNEPFRSLAVKICEGESTLPGGASLREAAASFLEKLTLTRSLDPAVFDLLDGSLVDVYVSSHFIVRRQDGHHIAVDGTKTAKMFYLITPKVVASLLVIFLDDPLAVLYLIRADLGPDPSDVTLALASRGVPVSARVLRDAVPTATYDPSFGLGFLPFDYRPHSSDYAAYLQRRDALLRRTYGRAAILRGGIVGRLARESLGDRVDFLVTSGPSDDVLRFGSCIKFGDARYWDDDLDCEDEEIICGVYKLSTGQQARSGQQTADVSWWPKQSTWEASGLNVGYWSTDDEVWYQKHLQKIREYDGKGKPPYRNASDWRTALKYRKDTTKKVRDYATQAAERWLAEHT